jgi:hypothetical protein
MTENIPEVPNQKLKTESSKKTVSEPKKQDTSIILNFTTESIELINLNTAQKHAMFPKTPGKIKLINTNLYRIPITNKTLNIDNFYAIRQPSKFSEYFKILCVKDGIVSIQPIVTGFDLNNNDFIGELI